MARITITDKTADAYQAIADRQGRGLDAVIEAQLSRFKHLVPGEKAIVVAQEDANRILGGNPVLNGTDLLARVTNLASISFHGIRLDFSPQQLRELETRAARQGKTVEQLAQAIANVVLHDFFYVSGGGGTDLQPHPSPRAASGA